MSNKLKAPKKASVTITNQKLYEIDVEMRQIAPRVLGMLLKGPMNTFYKYNGTTIKKLHENIEKIQRFHLEFQQGKIKYTKPSEEELKAGAKVELVYLEGKNNDTLNKAYKEFMDQETTLIV